MIRVVVVFESDTFRDTIGDRLDKSGIEVRYRCRTGAEAIRAIKKMGGGVIICGHKFPDMTADQLACELQNKIQMLVIAKPLFLDLCENDRIFRLPVPVNSGELIGSVNLLLQLDERNFRRENPRRSSDEEMLIYKAKKFIMAKRHVSEEEAHRCLQQESMKRSMKMADVAMLLIEPYKYDMETDP